MPTLDGKELPVALANGLTRLLEHIPGADLLAYAEVGVPFQVTKATVVRQYLTGQLLATQEISPSLLELVRRNVPGREFLEALAPSQLEELKDLLIALLGRETTALAMILNDRPEVRVLGWAVADSNPDVDSPWPAPDPGSAEKQLRLTLTRWLASVGVHSPAEVAPGGAAGGGTEGPDAADPTERVRRLERIVEDQRRRHKEEVRQLRTDLQAERAARAQERDCREVELKSAREVAANAGTNLAAEREARDRVVTSTLVAENRSLLRSWLTHATRVESEARTTEKDLLTRAAALLQAQAGADRHSGNRRQVLERIGSLNAVRQQLMDSSQNALNPLPAVTAHARIIGDEIQRLEMMLGARSSVSPVTRELGARIAACATAEQISSVRNALETLQDHDLIPAAERLELERALLRRHSLLAETWPVEATEAAEPGWSLRKILQRRSPARALIDGHNLILGLPEFFGDAGAHPGQERRARERLAAAVVRLGEQYHFLELELLLDGPRGSVQAPRSNVRIEYAGGTGGQRADQVLLGRLRHLTTTTLEAGWPRFLVTDDRQLRDEAAQEGARCVRTRAFALLLEDAGCLPPMGDQAKAH